MQTAAVDKYLCKKTSIPASFILVKTVKQPTCPVGEETMPYPCDGYSATVQHGVYEELKIPSLSFPLSSISVSLIFISNHDSLHLI